MKYWSLAFCGVAGLLAGCGEPAAKVSVQKESSTPAAAAAAPAEPKSSAASVASFMPAPKVALHEEDFSESERSRDPFHAFADAFVVKSARRNAQRQMVLLEQYALEDLKLVGIVTGIEPARAMLVDPTGQGHVIHRNELIGRAERVQTGGPNGAEFEINWRVERIRGSDVVLVREDPSNPDVPTATRVLALRPEEQK